MKRFLLIFALLPFGTVLFGQTFQPYILEDDLPDVVKVLPAPPKDPSPEFDYDILRYEWGKQQRLDSARARKAINEAVYEVDDMIAQFCGAFGMEISAEKTPAIHKVVKRAVETIRLSATKPKATYMRTRPYAYFDEPTLVPEEEEELRTNGSYPSGHTVRGWGMAMLLCEINPAAQDELYKLGYEWGQSRVIAGYHWQSDVDASRMLAAATYARLHTEPDFLRDMRQARREFRRLANR